ncbi:SMP-30/gluconolactonase/LRE family protein [Erythrobacter sp. W53]|uniref:SMP-30/gluconolactonase/LRE family protein n=1 Tax=Erythrobacter sp. W53 TaxID=3425947 RepID=UPI003D766E61
MAYQLTRRSLLSGAAASGLGLGLSGCMGPVSRQSSSADASVSWEVFDNRFSDIVASDEPTRLLGEGYQWAEGPAWDRDRKKLYFTDVPQNRAFQWREGEAVQTFLDPSGIAPDQATGMREPGANGLLQSRDGSLLICNHGKRAVEKMDLTSGERSTIVAQYDGKQFNSPNDIIEAADGTLYFTDPPYGLEGLDASPLKEMTKNGVYRVRPDGEINRLIDTMTFPNGVVLSPDESTLFISQSDPKAPQIRTLSLTSEASQSSLWFDASPFMDGHQGLPDGMAVSTAGQVFLAGPGGVLVIDQTGVCLGRIGTGRATANCTFGEDGRTLFITAQDRLLAVRTKVRGAGRFKG